MSYTAPLQKIHRVREAPTSPDRIGACLATQTPRTKLAAAHHLAWTPVLAQTILHGVESVISFNGEFF